MKANHWCPPRQEEPDMANPNPSLPLNIPDKPILSTAEVVSLAEVTAQRTEKLGKLINTFESGVASRVAESLARTGFTPRTSGPHLNAPFSRYATTQIAATAADGFSTCVFQGYASGTS